MTKTREDWLNAFMDAARPVFESKGYQVPANIRASVGFTSGGRRGKSIGECWSSVASKDDHFEIFVHPSLDDSSRVADVLTHEVAHAVVGLAARHGPKFRACATAMGLTGKMTATVAGPGFHAWAAPVLAALGPIPHGELRSGGTSAKPKQTTRMLKAECDTCGFMFRASRQWMESATEGLRCPDATCDGTMRCDAVGEG